MELKSSQVSDIIRVLSEDADLNIVATPEAGKKTVTIFLKKVNREDAIKKICRISDLWYRKDDTANGHLLADDQRRVQQRFGTGPGRQYPYQP